MGKYLEIAQKALQQRHPLSTEDDQLTKNQHLNVVESESPRDMQCELSELSEISPVTDQELRKSLEDDWDEVSNDPDQLEAARYSMRTAKQIAAGQVPESYTAVVECDHCGEVPVWPGYPNPTKGCPWCFNRLKGLPVPEV